MNKRSMFTTIGAVVMLVLLLLCYVLLSDSTSNDSVKTLEALQTYLVNGRIFDADGSIGVSDAYDIHYRWNDDEITISFGNNVMEFSREQLADPEISAMLENINLTLEGDVLYYEGVEVPR